MMTVTIQGDGVAWERITNKLILFLIPDSTLGPEA